MIEPGWGRRVIHPLNDDIPAHIVGEGGGTLRAVTETGAFHIERLGLNRAPLVALRRERRVQERLARSESDTAARLARLEQNVAGIYELLRVIAERRPESPS